MGRFGKYSSIGLDTNIFVYYFQENPQFGLIVKNLFQYLSKSKVEVVTSSISLTELLSVNVPPTLISLLQQEFLSIPFLSIMPVNNDIAIKAASIRRNYNFSLPDSIQLATAISTKVDIFITNDDRLKKFKEMDVYVLNDLE